MYQIRHHEIVIGGEIRAQAVQEIRGRMKKFTFCARSDLRHTDHPRIGRCALSPLSPPHWRRLLENDAGELIVGDQLTSDVIALQQPKRGKPCVPAGMSLPPSIHCPSSLPLPSIQCQCFMVTW